MFFFRIIFISLSLLGAFRNTVALESTDVLDTNILKVYDKNVLVLDRGVEDGIFKKDHIQITSRDGFIARGICLKVSLLSSHWKIYRVVRPELISKDASYRMRSINQSSIPKDLSKFAKVDFSKKYNDYSKEQDNKQLKLQQKRVITYDLPTRVKLSETVKAKEKSSLTKFVDRNFDNENLRYDLSRVFLDIYASPISIQTREDQKEIHYGFKINNYGEKYRYELDLLQKELKITDPVSKESYTSQSSEYGGNFQINRATDNFSIISSARYKAEQIGEIYYPKSQVRISPIGFRLHLWEEDPRTSFMDFTYSPEFETLRYSDPEDTGTLERTGIRHTLQARIFSKFTQNILNKTILTYAPMSNTNLEDTASSKMLNVNASTSFTYEMANKFSFEYILEYEADKFRSHVYNISKDNTIQTIRFHREFDI